MSSNSFTIIYYQRLLPWGLDAKCDRSSMQAFSSISNTQAIKAESRVGQQQGQERAQAQEQEQDRRTSRLKMVAISSDLLDVTREGGEQLPATNLVSLDRCKRLKGLNSQESKVSEVSTVSPDRVGTVVCKMYVIEWTWTRASWAWTCDMTKY